MQTETGAGEAKAGGKKQRVQDEFGGIYELKSKLAEGGQGIVLSTDFQNLLVKVSRWPDGDPRTQAWRKQVEALQRMPVVDEGLPVVMPKARIVKPRAGYVMELVDGLIPLELLLKESIESFASGMGLQGFVSSGGLARRLRVLARLARVLAQLHGLGLAHGDISPKNVFVSTSHDQGEVWLIDCDNLTYAVRDSSLQVYTPDYGAPEILRGDAGISTYTDVWSFAVIAFQLLVQLHPFKGGELVDQDSDLEVAALRGELPWIDHRDDARNRSAMGIDREYVLTPLLVELFDRCFRLSAEAAKAKHDEALAALETDRGSLASDRTALEVRATHGVAPCLMVLMTAAGPPRGRSDGMEIPVAVRGDDRTIRADQDLQAFDLR